MDTKKKDLIWKFVEKTKRSCIREYREKGMVCPRLIALSLDKMGDRFISIREIPPVMIFEGEEFDRSMKTLSFIFTEFVERLTDMDREILAVLHCEQAEDDRGKGYLYIAQRPGPELDLANILCYRIERAPAEVNERGALIVPAARFVRHHFREK